MQSLRQQVGFWMTLPSKSCGSHLLLMSALAKNRDDGQAAVSSELRRSLNWLGISSKTNQLLRAAATHTKHLARWHACNRGQHLPQQLAFAHDRLHERHMVARRGYERLRELRPVFRE